MDWIMLVSFPVLGLFAGVLAGMFGIGGGLVIVPVLVLVFGYYEMAPDYRMHLAIGTSLGTIIFTSISSLLAHHRRGAVLWPTVFRLVPGIVVGGFLGAAIADALLDRAEDAAAIAIEHLDADSVAEFQKRRFCTAVFYCLQHASLGNAGGATRSIVVGNGSRADHGAGAEITGFCCVFDELLKIERHIDSAVRLAEQGLVYVDSQRSMYCSIVPVLAKFVRCDGHG